MYYIFTSIIMCLIIMSINYCEKKKKEAMRNILYVILFFIILIFA